LVGFLLAIVVIDVAWWLSLERENGSDFLWLWWRWRLVVVLHIRVVVMATTWL